MCGGTTSARWSHAKLPAGRPPPRKRDGTRQAFGASEEVAQPQRASAAKLPRAQSESKHEEVHGSGARMEGQKIPEQIKNLMKSTGRR